MFFFPVQVCAGTLSARLPSRICKRSLSISTHQLSTDHFNHVPVVTGTVPPALSTDSQGICRSVIGSSESSEFKSDLGLRIIDTACLFCVAGSDWFANYKNVLEDISLKHEIDETREAEIQIW